MKFLKFAPLSATTNFCHFDRTNLNDVNRSTDEKLTGDMAEMAERRLNALRAAAPTVALSLDILSEQIRPSLTVNTFHGSRLRLRNDRGKIIGHMNDNSRVTFQGESKISRDANGQSIDTDVPPDGSLENRHLWFKVKTSNGQIGWASAEYLEGSLMEAAPVIPEPVVEPEPVEDPPIIDIITEEPEIEDEPLIDITIPELPELNIGDTPFYRAPAAAALERITDNHRAQAAVAEAARASAEYEKTTAKRAVNGHNPPPEPINEAERVTSLPVDEQVARIAADTEVPPDRVRAMLMDLSRWDEEKILANPEGFRTVVEDLNARYGEDFAKFAPRAMDVAPALAFFKSPAIRPIIGKWLPAIGGGLLWSRVIGSEGSDWTSFHAPDERWNTGNIAVDTGAYFVPIAGNFKDFNDARIEWREGSYGMAAISVASGTVGMVLDGFSIATAWTGVGFVAGQGAKIGVKTGVRALKAGVKYLVKDSTRSVWDVMTFRALRPGAAGVDAATATLRGQRASDAPETGAREGYETTRPETPVAGRTDIDSFTADVRFHQNANRHIDVLKADQNETSFMHEGMAFNLTKNTEGHWEAVDADGNRLPITRTEDLPSLRENTLQRSLDFYDQNIMPRVRSQIDAMPALFNRLRSSIPAPQRFKRQAETVIGNLKDFEWNRFNVMGPNNRAELSRAHQQGEAEFKRVKQEQAQYNVDQAQKALDTRTTGWRRIFTRNKTQDAYAEKLRDAEAELNRVQSSDASTLVREHENNSWWNNQFNQLGHRVSEMPVLNRGEQKAALKDIKALRQKNQTLSQHESSLRRLESQRDQLPAGTKRRSVIAEIETVKQDILTARKDIEDQVAALYNRTGETESRAVVNDRISELETQLTATNNTAQRRAIRQELEALERFKQTNIGPRLSSLKSSLNVGNNVRLTASNGQVTEFRLAEVRTETAPDGSHHLILRGAADNHGEAHVLKVETEGDKFRVTNVNNTTENFVIERIEDVPVVPRRPRAEAEQMYQQLKTGSVIRFLNQPNFSITIKEINTPSEGAVVELSGDRGRGLESGEVDFRRSRILNHLENTNTYIE